MGQLSEKSLGISVLQESHETLLSSSTSPALASLQGAKAVILVISPFLFDFLVQQSSCSFNDIITDPQKVMLFLCGVEMSHFGETKLLDRFPHLDICPNYTHEDVMKMLENAIRVIDKAEEQSAVVEEVEATQPPLFPRTKLPSTASPAKNLDEQGCKTIDNATAAKDSHGKSKHKEGCKGKKSHKKRKVFDFKILPETAKCEVSTCKSYFFKMEKKIFKLICDLFEELDYSPVCS